MEIPYARPYIGEEEIKAVIETLESGWLTSGPKVRELESGFSGKFGRGLPAVAVDSCTSGLWLSLFQSGIGPGDEVILPSFNFAAGPNAVRLLGGKPVFADINPETLNMNPVAVRDLIGERTKAVMVVHLGGNACEMDQWEKICKEHGLILVEDCAHAAGGKFMNRELGTFGDFGVFSFYPTKNIASAEGGMIICRNGKDAQRLMKIRKHGFDQDTWDRLDPHSYNHYDISEPGFKMNMTDLQAAIALVQIGKFGEMQERRREIRAMYDSAFSAIQGLSLVKNTPQSTHACHLYQVLLTGAGRKERDDCIRSIQSEGVKCSVNYTPVHLFSGYSAYRETNLPYSKQAGDEVIALPFYPGLSDEEVNYVIDVVQRTVNK